MAQGIKARWNAGDNEAYKEPLGKVQTGYRWQLFTQAVKDLKIGKYHYACGTDPIWQFAGLAF